MKTKRSIKSKVIDLAIILLCMAGSITSGTAFYKEYNRTLSKLNEEQIGTIVFKKRTAQRKFIDRVVWDRLREETPLYNGDTIRTIELSEAIITFRDQVTHLTLYENTLIQIFYNDIDGLKVDFSGGRLDVSSPRGVLVTSGSQEIFITGQASMGRNEDGLNLSVMDGEARTDGQRVTSGNAVTYNNSGQRDTRPVIAMTSFGPAARIIGKPGQTVPVTFSWNTSNFTPDTRIVVEVALDSNFNRIVASEITNRDSIVLNLGHGNYKWRVYPVTGETRAPSNSMYPSGNMEIIAASELYLVSPSETTQVLSERTSGVSFTWTRSEGAQSYLLEVSQNENMTNPVVSRNVRGTSVNIRDLEENTWYWRVTPVLPSWVIGELPSSAVGNFSVVQNITVRPAQPEPVTVTIVPDPPPPEPVRQTITITLPNITLPQFPVITIPEFPTRQSAEADPIEELLIVSEIVAVHDFFPPNGYTVTTEQLASVPAIYFSWEGGAGEFRIEMFRITGERIIEPSVSEGNVFTFHYPTRLTEGEYIWQVYEREGRNWQPRPSAALRFTVVRGTPPIRVLPTSDPGDMYGNP